jgi:DNA modification methylase
MSDDLFWRNRITESGVADPQELAKGYNILNWRHHPQIQRDALEDALDSIGVLQPVLFNKSSGRVIDGHLRIELAILKGQPLIPVNYVELTDDEEALALATLDAITEQAEPIADKLAALLERTQAMTIDRPGLAGMLAALKARAGINGHQQKEDSGPQIDKAAELQKVWGVKAGDVWELEQHRLACGDCTDRATVEAVMRGELFNVLVTDPPYGVNYEGGRNPISNVPREKLSGDSSSALYGAFLSVWKDHRADKGVLYIWFADRGGKPVYEAVENNGFEIRALIIWNKIDPHYGNFMAQYMQKHEPCLYCVRDGTNWYGPTNEVTVWDIKQPNINEFHPTQKPMECMTRPMENSSKEGDLIIDPFLGSGTTLIACEQLGRRCRGVEIDPSYCSVTLQRYADLTGQTPRRVSG